MIFENVIHELAAIVGPQNLLTSPEERWGYAYDATDRAAMPELVVFPGSAAEVAAIVRLANEIVFRSISYQKLCAVIRHLAGKSEGSHLAYLDGRYRG